MLRLHQILFCCRGGLKSIGWSGPRSSSLFTGVPPCKGRSSDACAWSPNELSRCWSSHPKYVYLAKRPILESQPRALAWVVWASKEVPYRSWCSLSSNAWPCSIWRCTAFHKSCTQRVSLPHASWGVPQGCFVCCTFCHSPQTHSGTYKRFDVFSRGLSESISIWTLTCSLGKSIWTSNFCPFHGWSDDMTSAKAFWNFFNSLHDGTCKISRIDDFWYVVSA